MACLESTDDEEALRSSIPQFVDVFPSVVFNRDLSKNFCSALPYGHSMEMIKRYQKEAIPLKMMDDKGMFLNKIYFMQLMEDRGLLLDRLERLHKNCQTLYPRNGLENVDWCFVDNRLNKNPRLAHKKFNKDVINKTDGKCRKGNADNRLSYCWRNNYLVRQYFTFGEIQTSEGEVHLYLVYNVPILVYISKNGPCFEQRTFNASRKGQYDTYIMQPKGNQSYTAYVIKENRSYTIMTMQKTGFATFRLRTDLFDRILEKGKMDVVSIEEDDKRFKPLSTKELEKKFGKQKRKRENEAVSLDTLWWDTRPKILTVPSVSQEVPMSDTPNTINFSSGIFKNSSNFKVNQMTASTSASTATAAVFPTSASTERLESGQEEQLPDFEEVDNILAAHIQNLKKQEQTVQSYWPM